MLNTFDYIKCFENTFWSWDTDERYVNIKGGSTFAHWDEVVQYVLSLAPMGLPLFDVVMGIVASSANDDFESTSHLIKNHLLADLDDSKRKEQLKIFETISQVESKYKTGENRFLLIATVLEKANVKKIAIVTNKIVEDLNDPEQDFFGSNGKNARIHLRAVVNCFNQLSTFFPDPESIVDAMLGFDMQKLNLENIIPRSSEEQRGEKGSLLDELENETRTEKIAALIPYVMSGMNFPIHSTLSDERPDGGVSDLSNKGHFDQLIVSEFAYDDDYFLSRIVNGEALFYEREKAKNENDNDLCILIDASLYMWGLPKLIATAIGCTVGLKEQDVDLDCYFVGDDLLYCDFRTIEGVLKGIRIANASISPAEGLNAFHELDKEYSNLLFVTTEDSWSRPEMMGIREGSSQWCDFIIFVSENAEIKIQKSKGKQIADFKLDTDTIWELKKDNKRSLPVYTPSEFPILFPIYNDRVKYFFGYGEDSYFIDKSKGLYRFNVHKESSWMNKGATFLRKIALDLVILGDIGLNDKGELELLMFNQKNRVIMIYNLTNKTEQTLDFSLWKSNYGFSFYHENNCFQFVSHKGSILIDKDIGSKKEMGPYDSRLYRASEERQRNIYKKHHGYQGFLKNISAVYISTQGEIVIQNKRIETKTDTHFGFFEKPIGKVGFPAEVTRSGQHKTFAFNSGESIITNPAGVLIFRFSNKNKPNGYELVLRKVGEQKLGSVKAIKHFSGKGLRECKELADRGNGSITISSNLNDLNKYAHELRGLGNNVEVLPLRLGGQFFMNTSTGTGVAFASSNFFSGNVMFKDESMSSGQRLITTIEFYDLYLRTFIENIRNGV